MTRQVLQLAERLDAREPRPDEHERQRPTAYLWIGHLVRGVELGQDAVPEPDRLREGPEPDALLGEPRHREGPRPGPGAQDQHVVRLLALVTAGQPDRRQPGGVVDPPDLSQDEAGPLQRAAERHDDRAGIDQPARDLREEGLIGHEVLRADQDQLMLGSEPTLEVTSGVEPDVATADDQDPAHAPFAARCSIAPGSSVRSRTDASVSASCSGVGSSGASPRSTHTVRIPAAFAGRTS